MSERPDSDIHRRILFGLTILVAASFGYKHAFVVNGQDRWKQADVKIGRLSPTAFSELPRQIVVKLLSLGCTIPQTNDISGRHNVIKGSFQRPNQTDWAVLCSRHRTSSILIFWRGSTQQFSEIGKQRDNLFLQTVGGGAIAFSRKISPVGQRYILDHYREYHGPTPPPLNHQGIDDGFLGKASTIHFYYGHKWRELQGAD